MQSIRKAIQTDTTSWRTAQLLSVLSFICWVSSQTHTVASRCSMQREAEILLNRAHILLHLVSCSRYDISSYLQNYSRQNIYESISSFWNIVTPPNKQKQQTPWLSPRASYTDWETTTCRRSYCQLLRMESATWSVWWIPTAVLSVSRPEPLMVLSSSSIVLVRLSGLGSKPITSQKVW
jgi:hypothetical protein